MGQPRALRLRKKTLFACSLRKGNETESGRRKAVGHSDGKPESCV